MIYVILDDPLRAIEPSGFKGFTVPLNVAESILRNQFGRKIELTDLSEAFDLGQRGVFSRGKLIGWEEIPVF